MFFKMLKGALWRQKKKNLLIIITIALGTSLATAMLSVMLDVGNKVNQELKTYGANINLVSKEASLLDDLYGVKETEGQAQHYLNESDLPKIKTIFWAYNIVDFAPSLTNQAALTYADKTEASVPIIGTWFQKKLDLPTGESVTTGIQKMKNWWEIEGAWPKDQAKEVLIGEKLAKKMQIKVADSIDLVINGNKQTLKVSGVFHSGSEDDLKVYLPLGILQEAAGLENKISQVEVSALTTPENELSKKAARNPQALSAKDWETWYCTAYVSSIAYQLEEAIAGTNAKVIRQVADSEGTILEKTEFLMILITILSLLGTILAISNIITASVLERSKEIGLLKAIGGSNLSITAKLLTEIIFVGLIGGAIGLGLGFGLAQVIGQTVFNTSIAMQPIVIPLVIVLVLLVTVSGSLQSIRILLGLKPAQVLHGR